jgi:hypothetical protein
MSEALHESWLALQAWWQGLTPGSQAFLRGAAVLLGAFLAGLALGRIAGRRLRDRDFDASLRPPWLPSAGGRWAETWPFTPTGLVGGLACGTVWGAGVWWVATEQGQGWAPLARGLEWAAGRVWSLAVVLVVALYLSRFLAGQVIDLLQSPPLGEKLDGWLPRAGGDREPRGSGAALAGTAVYGVAFLLVLLIAADLFGWALTGSVVSAAWLLLLHAVTAGAAMLIGWLGYR